MMIISKLYDAMREIGAAPASIGDIARCSRGDLVRFQVDGDKPRTRNGWLSIFPDGEGAVFGSWKNGSNGHWFTDDNKVDKNPSDWKAKEVAISAAMAAADRQRKAEQLTAARHCLAIWERAAPADPDHPYLARKQIKPHGLRQVGDALLVPVLDETGIISLQFIKPDGTKRFASGGRTKGGRYAITTTQNNHTLLICEGFATGASLAEAKGLPVVIAFNAGNLEPVAKAMRRQYPHKPIVICADCDPVGIEKGKAAAKAVNGRLELPPIPEGVAGTDFNDYAIWQAGGGV